MAKEEVKLFGTWSSPFSLRVTWALKLKGVEYEFIEEDLSNKSSLLLQYNSVHKKIPVLVHNGKPISESSVILEYIDETWKGHNIFPVDDPHERASARFWAKFVDDKLLPSLWNVFVTQGKEQEEASLVALENLRNIEKELEGKKYFGGEMIGFVDIILGCIANMADILDEITGLKTVEKDKLPLLSAWIENFSSAPIIKDSWPSGDRLVTKYRLYRTMFAPPKSS
ncbi:hypothetical protein GIB67_010600 [Kingdonia uniflora]|uniref:glutathione transferase n=1 Tax=Kingdonia uniflora TaxID=39325 RepID=A0A7J7MAV5_9MAGN|nr:hypothetical protein GIB67_010600 [Kingdonia uniflora]